MSDVMPAMWGGSGEECGKLELLLCFVKKRTFRLGQCLPLRNAINLKPHAREHEAVLEETQLSRSIQSLNHFIISQKSVSFKNAAPGCYDYENEKSH